VLELEHASVLDVFVNAPETGVWGVGTGWEMPLAHSLPRYLAGELPDAPAAEWYEPTPEDVELGNRLGEAWAAVVAADRDRSS